MNYYKPNWNNGVLDYTVLLLIGTRNIQFTNASRYFTRLYQNPFHSFKNLFSKAYELCFLVLIYIIKFPKQTSRCSNIRAASYYVNRRQVKDSRLYTQAYAYSLLLTVYIQVYAYSLLLTVYTGLRQFLFVDCIHRSTLISYCFMSTGGKSRTVECKYMPMLVPYWYPSEIDSRIAKCQLLLGL